MVFMLIIVVMISLRAMEMGSPTCMIFILAYLVMFRRLTFEEMNIALLFMLLLIYVLLGSMLRGRGCFRNIS